MTAVSFFVPGRPMPKGSKTPVRTRSGAIRVLEGRDHVQRARIELWAAAIRATATDWMRRHGYETSPFERYDALCARYEFFIARPKRPANPSYPVTPPDRDKLERLVSDELVRVGLIPDDARIVAGPVRKAWESHSPIGAPGCHVTIARHDPTGGCPCRQS